MGVLKILKIKKDRPALNNISFDKKFIFIHIPKNAGTSIYRSLELKKSSHKTVKEYIKILGDAQYESMFSFAFVRNPFSRFISLYNYAKMEISHYHNNIEPEKSIYGPHLDFKILKNASIEEAAILLREGKLIHNPPHNQWMPQTYWLKDRNDKINVKYLGRVEDLSFNLRNIFSIVQIQNKNEVARVNVSSNEIQNYRSLINKETRDILEEYYYDDLKTFNYNF